MWSLLKKNDDECGKLRDLLEDSAAGLPAATRMEELSEAWPAAQRNHLATCGRCQEAAQDLLATREIFKGVGSATGMVRPWFSTRVVAAIAARERELTEAACTWLAVQAPGCTRSRCRHRISRPSHWRHRNRFLSRHPPRIWMTCSSRCRRTIHE